MTYRTQDNTHQTLYVKFCQDHPEYQKLYSSKVESMKQNNEFKNPYQDSGFDIFSPQKVVCKAGETTKIKLGVACAVFTHTQSGDVPTPYYVYPRSSISKTPLRLANSVGIIDSGYRGELMAVVDNISKEDYIVEEGHRLFQICSNTLVPFSNVKITEELNSTERGAGGFGSTGQ